MPYKKYIYFVIIASQLLLCNHKMYSLGENRLSGARNAGMGMNSISLVSVYSVYNNQAAGAFLENPAFGIYYSSVFLNQGVNNISLVSAIPIKKAGTFGLSIGYFGYDAYNDKKFGLSYGLKLSKYFSIGTQLDILNTSISGFGNKTFFTFELGLFSKPVEELAIAAHVYNPLRITVDKNTGEKLPTVFKIGATYEAAKKFYISLELEKDLEKKIAFKAGIDYTIKNLIGLRFGVASDPAIITFGVGALIKKGLRIDVASSYHFQLGFTPHIGISYDLQKKKK